MPNPPPQPQWTWPGKRIIVTGGAGFLGRQVCRVLRERGVADADIFIPRSKDYDLTNADAVARLYRDAFPARQPDMVIHLAAEVGGIGANKKSPGRYFYANMAMALHLIEHARTTGLHARGGKFIQTGTVCAYPKFAKVPFREEDIWEGYPEETNAPYGVAKKAAWQMLDSYKLQYDFTGVYVLPVNLYGPWDNFHPESSHVIPGLIRKCIDAVRTNADHIVCWGDGSPSREFLYVDDAAEGIVRAAEVMNDPTPINLGTGYEITIKDLTALIARLTGFTGEIRWDTTKPNGQPRRQLSTERAEKLLNWRAHVPFEDGLKRTIQWFREHG